MQIEEADPGKGTKQNQKCMGPQDKRRQAFREERVGSIRSHSAEVFEEDGRVPSGLPKGAHW